MTTSLNSARQPLIVVLLLTNCALAQSTHPTSQPTYTAHRAATPIEIDGKLDDEAWATAPWTSDFINILGPAPDHPAPPHRTRGKILWTESHLYVAVELTDPDIRGTMTKRGSPIHKENCFELFLDPDGDGRDYWEIEINAHNTVLDLQMSRPYRDGGRPVKGARLPNLRTAVHVQGTLNDPSDADQSWTIELAIPFADLGVTPTAGHTWRVNLARIHYIGKTPHLASWSALGAKTYHVPEKFGTLLLK